MIDPYEKIIQEIGTYPKNHYKAFGLIKTVNLHISGLKMTAKKMKGTSVSVFCSREANRYQKLLDYARGVKDGNKTTNRN